MKLRLFSLILNLILIFSFGSLQAQATQFRGLDRNGIYPDTSLLDIWPEQGPELMATIDGIGDGYGSPSMNEKGIYISGMIDSAGYIFHFNHQHQLKWKIRYGKEFTFKFPGARGMPTILLF